MKNILFNFDKIIFIIIGLISTNPSYAVKPENTPEKKWVHSGMIVKQDGKIIFSKGKYDTPQAPFSTFKVALALMGFDSGILQTKDSPKWPFRQEYEKNFQSWYTRQKGIEYHWCQDHTPATFMKNSVVWFSHQITQRLGKEKFEEYVSRLNYGNKDVSGTAGQDDGLLNSWLGTSLKISPRGQVEFLEQLLANKLDLSTEAQEKTKEIMDREEEWKGWKLYGKTGGGHGRSGWFIGWIEKGAQRIVFALYLDLTDEFDFTGLPSPKSIGLTAKEIIRKEISNLLE